MQMMRQLRSPIRKARFSRTAFATILLTLTSVACGPSVGPTSPWKSSEESISQFPVEVSATPPAPPARELNPGDTLRATTFNVHEGKDVEGIVRQIRGNDSLSVSDVLFLQEVRSYPKEGRSRASRIASGLGMAYVYAAAKTVEDGGTHGLAILSRYPLENIAIMELPRGEIVVDTERRIALSADVRVNSNRLHLVNVHLDTRLNATERILQLRPAVIDAPSPSIIAGDFNTNPLTWAFNTIPLLPLGSFGDTDQAPILDDYMRSIGMKTPTADFGTTVQFPVLEPRLDSIYLRGLESAAGAIERDVSISDHWPIWLDVTLPRQ